MKFRVDRWGSGTEHKSGGNFLCSEFTEVDRKPVMIYGSLKFALISTVI